MNRKLEEDLEAIATSIDSITEILFAVQLLDDGKEQVKIDTMLELPIKELERIRDKINVYLKEEKWLENTKNFQLYWFSKEFDKKRN